MAIDFSLFPGLVGQTVGSWLLCEPLPDLFAPWCLAQAGEVGWQIVQPQPFVKFPLEKNEVQLRPILH